MKQCKQEYEICFGTVFLPALPLYFAGLHSLGKRNEAEFASVLKENRFAPCPIKQILSQNVFQSPVSNYLANNVYSFDQSFIKSIALQVKSQRRFFAIDFAEIS